MMMSMVHVIIEADAVVLRSCDNIKNVLLKRERFKRTESCCKWRAMDEVV